MTKWEVFATATEDEAVKKIKELELAGYQKEDISILAKRPKEIEDLAEEEQVEVERPVNEEAFGIISGILQSLSGGLVLPQVYTPNGAFYAAGPFAKWFSRTDDKSVRRLLGDFDLTKEEIDQLIEHLDQGDILVLAR
ncbi:general stress protein [Listeria costaricensis]|uniref:general stress protein n=1 Tax=Listeria costaricensis TaxID=2026604 RepID=UPI000C077969|nr:general stress protein [Listeria costaricensis]